MTQLPPTTLTHDHATPERGRPWPTACTEGEEFAVTFGGQGADWFATLTELVDEHTDTSRIDRTWSRSPPAWSAPVAGQLAAALPRPFEPQLWLDRDEAPRRADTISAALGMPGVLLTQLATLDLLADEGLDLAAHRTGRLGRPLARASSASPRSPDAARPPRAAVTASDVELMAIARLIGAAATIVGRRAGLVPHGEDSPMLAVSGATLAEVEALVAEASDAARRRRRRRRQRPAPRRRERHPGRPPPPPQGHREAQRRRGRRARGQGPRRSRRSTRPSSRSRSPSASTTPPWLPPSTWSATGPRPAASTPASPSTSPTPSASRPSTGRVQLTDAVGPETRWVVDLGPADLSANMTGRALRGRGVTVIPAATDKGRDLALHRRRRGAARPPTGRRTPPR